jgi:uncharacterized protein (DUF305 family)
VPRRRLALAGTVAAGALLLTACGGDGTSGTGRDTDHVGSHPSASAADPAASGAFNQADVMFAQGMIPHHQQAVDMAEAAAGRASDQEIKELAQQIKKAQDPEIAVMRSWLRAWGEPESPGTGHSGGGHGHGGAAGMMSDEDMAALKAAEGRPFDRDFARMMIEHHNGAIEMAMTERRDGRNADARKLAEAVIKGQSAEVDRLEGILDRL